MDPNEAPLDPAAAYEEATAALGGRTQDTRLTISEHEVEIARALGEALVPPDIRGRLGGEDVDPGALLAEYARGWPVEYRLALRASLRFIEWAPIVFQIKPRASALPLTTFTAMDQEDRERVVKRLDEAHSYHARMLFKVAKTLLYALYYGQPSVSRALGYDAAEVRARGQAAS